MALGAIAAAEPTQMHLGLRMAGGAALGGPLVGLVDVAGLAIDAAMLAGQLEGRAIVVETGHVGDDRVCAFVLGMAGLTLMAVGHQAVQRPLGIELAANVSVAI